jgi:hypothetical protein
MELEYNKYLLMLFYSLRIDEFNLSKAIHKVLMNKFPNQLTENKLIDLLDGDFKLTDVLEKVNLVLEINSQNINCTQNWEDLSEVKDSTWIKRCNKCNKYVYWDDLSGEIRDRFANHQNSALSEHYTIEDENDLDNVTLHYLNITREAFKNNHIGSCKIFFKYDWFNNIGSLD